MVLVQIALYILSSLVCLSGGALLLTRSGTAPGRAFACGFLSLAAAQISAMLVHVYGLVSAAGALTLFELASISCFLVAVLSLERNIQEKRWIISSSRVVLFLLCVAYGLSVVLWGYHRWVPAQDEPHVIGVTGRAQAVILLLCCVVFIWIMENILRSSQGTLRRALRYPAVGAISVAGALCMLAVHRLSTNILAGDIQVLSALMVLVGAAMFVFFSVRFRLFDMDVFVSRYIVYHSLTFVGIGLYLVLTGAVIWGIRLMGLQWSVVLTGFVAFMAFVLLLVFALSPEARQRIRFFINTHFFANKYDYRKEWVELSGYLTIAYTERQIVHVTSQVILDSMYITDLSIWLLKRGAFVRALSFPREGGDAAVRSDHPFPRYLAHKGCFLRGVPPQTEDEAWETVVSGYGHFLDANRIELAVGMFAGSDLIGFIAVGKQRPGTLYGQDDIDLLMAIASQASSALVKAWYAETLAENKELDTYNRMSASMLHDLKNASGHLSLILQNAPRYMDREDFRRDMLDTIQQALARIDKVVSKLSTSSHPEELHVRTFDVGAFFDDLLKRLRPRLMNVELIRSTDDGAVVNTDRDVLERIVENLMVNAIEAVDENGRIEVEAFESEGCMYIRVSDNGRGMTDEFMRDRLFRPFQTTKPRGTGLGLWQVKNMAERIGAWIDVERNDRGGMTFTVTFKAKGGPKTAPD